MLWCTWLKLSHAAAAMLQLHGIAAQPAAQPNFNPTHLHQAAGGHAPPALDALFVVDGDGGAALVVKLPLMRLHTAAGQE